ncbi:MAG TPA: peptidoglycan-associated lipoprotein Pal [Candidatus Contendobacter sp.]|nr:peptidoglycan-associated lipoprotein Pal [Candidatus Contendobacter sp.]HRD49760.1 peptidoglycan-associated lipoprotein Pal [Candidatus Contendobacter sp.]
MQHFARNLMASAALALMVGCAATGENTGADQTGVQQDATAQPGITAQPGQDAYSYAYGQAPSGYDTYDASGGSAGGRPGQAVAGAGGAVSADRIVYFDFDSAEIRPESQTIIESNARSLAGNRRIITQLEGHTDERGSREYNIALGERRANAVRQIMIALGVSPQQVRVVSYGEERPAAGGQSEQSYALNRRVEIVY